ncbi:MAG: hypothetical protein COB45_04840 [Gammaproteobacteria bacterium]|nr:MAG: hypothetical protein COB45_04840 [Gammaproteobacteria bacterium]PHR82710.1 MAG: hypothetical protein COA59_13845 [Colwellia sp.]
MCFILQVNFQLVLSFVLSLIFLKEANTSMFQVDSFTVELINILILLLFHIAAQQKDLKRVYLAISDWSIILCCTASKTNISIVLLHTGVHYMLVFKLDAMRLK